MSHIPGSKRVDHEAEEPWKDIDFKNTDKGYHVTLVGGFILMD